MKFIILLIIITILDIGALVTARYYIEKRKRHFMISSLSIFALSAFVFVQLMAFEVTAVINVLYAAISSVFVTLFYYIVFKERITRGQWMGIGLALLGVLLLEI